jgi:protease IV
MLPRATQAVDNVVTGIGEARRRRTAGLILELDLTEPLVEGVPADPLSAALARRKTPLRVALDGLRRASRDARVLALVVKAGGPRSVLRLATAQELGDAIREFRGHGKIAVAWAETFGEFNNGSTGYYLATFCDEVWLQPSGDVGLTGVATEVPFLRDALDKAGITPQLAQRHEYKNAANVFTQRAFTEAHREATSRIVESVMEQLVSGIATNRSLDRGDVRALVDRAPLFASEAVESGLVDRLGYRDDVYDAVRERVGADAIQQYVRRYARPKLGGVPNRLAGARDTVALVHVTGPIHLGSSGRQRFAMASAGSDTVVAALRSATKAPDVKAIVLRVTSPGGSYVASDAVWRQVALTRATGKPVVVSMGDVAASGGYFVSMGADVIVAEPGTLTGSIGAVAGKQVVDGLVARIGIGHDAVAEGKQALMYSSLREFSSDEWDRLNAWLDRVYDDFTAKVAAARGLSAERMDEVARGRVWTGADAKQHGLVDELGGLRTALELARDRAGLPASAEIEVRLYPRVPLIARMRPAQSSEDPAAATARLRIEGWGAFAAMAMRLGLSTFGPLSLADDHYLT